MSSAQDEPLTICETDPSERVYARSVYYDRGYRSALDAVWLRERAWERCREAARSLPSGLALLVLDGWRPLSLQAELYAEYRALLGQRGLEGAALERETQKFVSAPSADQTSPPPHLTGGAVDLVLADERGRALGMGGEYDELSERSRTDRYALATSPPERVWRERREILLRAMCDVGFSNYPAEWWHFDTGNSWHHQRVGGRVIYGAVTELPDSARTSSESDRDAYSGSL